MFTRLHNRFAIVVAALTSAVLLAGCGAPTPPSATSSAAQVNAKPVSGGQFTVAITKDPDDWDPSFTGRGSAGLAMAYNSLLSFKTGPDIGETQVVLQPALAESWEVSPDAKTFTFHLRKGVKFADMPPLNGRELTSADVKWTVEYRTRTGEVKDKKLPVDQLAFLFDGLDKVEAPDPYTAIISFKSPYVPFINYAASQWNPILPREIYLQDGTFKDHIVGTGPYQFDASDYQRGTRLTFQKNPTYWESGKPYLDTIRQFVIPTEATAFAAFQTKQLDVIDNMAYQGFKTVSAASPNVPTFKYHAVQSSFVFLSQARGGPLTDQRVRQAIYTAVDRDEINRVVAGGEGEWGLPGVMPGLFTEQEVKQNVKQDVEQAKKLMNDAGYGAGFSLNFSVSNQETQGNLAVIQLVQSQLKRIGVNITLLSMDPTDLTAKRRMGDFDMDYSSSATGSLTMDVDSWVYGRYRTGSTGDYTKLSDPELDKILDASRQETDPLKRQELQKKASLRIKDMAWSANLIYEPIYAAWQPRVKDYHPWFSDKAPYRLSWIQQ